MKLGHYNKLRIVRFTDHGAVLDGDGIVVLMPKKYTREDQHPGDEVEVFVYLDQSDRLVATTERPYAEVGQFAYLRVAWTNRYGAFMDWGLTKDLFVPFSEQRHHFMKDKSYLIYIYIDDQTGRIVGTSKLDRNLSTDFPDVKDGDEVDVLVWKKTDLGFKVIVNNAYEGLIYDSEIFRPVTIGLRLQAFVKNVRPDGKIDIILQHSGRQLVDDISEQLIATLEANGGFLPYGDHTPPEIIAKEFHISKKAFKRTLGALYRQHIVTITSEGILLNATD